MYLDFFGFTKHPFHIGADSDFLYVSQQHARAMVYMDYATWKPDGFVVITGEIGSGKTTLIRWVQNKIQGKANCLLIDFTNLTGNDLFHYLLRQVDIVPEKVDKISLIYYFHEYLISSSKSENPCVLIIDEAQNLTKDQLEDIRMLAALDGPDGPLLRVTLLGQPEFVDTINASEQFKQRVKLHYHLSGLSIDDTTKYIDYRMSIAGLTNNKLFNVGVVKEIYKYSKGIPRVINKICDALLMCAYADERKKLMVGDLDSVLQDLMIFDSGESVNNLTRRSDNVNLLNSEDESFQLLGRLVSAIESINDNIKILASKK